MVCSLPARVLIHNGMLLPVSITLLFPIPDAIVQLLDSLFFVREKKKVYCL